MLIYINHEGTELVFKALHGAAQKNRVRKKMNVAPSVTFPCQLKCYR